MIRIGQGVNVPRKKSLAELVLEVQQVSPEETKTEEATTETANPEPEPQSREFYINGKGQLIKIAQIERRGVMTEAHTIVSFDINSLPEANHGYSGMGAQTTGLVKNIPRAKVPVRDGHSQGVSTLHFPSA